MLTASHTQLRSQLNQSNKHVRIQSIHRTEWTCTNLLSNINMLIVHNRNYVWSIRILTNLFVDERTNDMKSDRICWRQSAQRHTIWAKISWIYRVDQVSHDFTLRNIQSHESLIRLHITVSPERTEWKFNLSNAWIKESLRTAYNRGHF